MSGVGTAKRSIVSYNTAASPSFKKSKGKEKDKIKTARAGSKQVPIILEGVDVTPNALNPYVYEGGKERQMSSLLDNLTKETSFMKQHSFSIGRVESQKFQTTLLLQKQEGESGNFAHHKSIVTSHYFADDLVIPTLGKSDYSQFSQFSAEQIDVQSIDETKPDLPIPEHISLILKETETVFLLDLPSSTVSKTSDEANDVEEDNKLYEYLTKGKGRNRKVLSVGVQTVPILKKARDAETKKIHSKNSSTYVSVWEMFDTYNEVERDVSDEENEDALSLSDEGSLELGLEDHRLNEEASLESYRASLEEKQLTEIVKSKSFQDALTVMERILGNNSYNAQQKRFKGLSDPDVFRENIEYRYRLELLWTYANDETEGRCVTGLTFNSFNEDIVAVAYGKYFYNDRNCLGMVMIWNIKNPQQPERQYDFSVPVTAIDFSKVNPNLLAVGFYNGHIKILDVSKREVFEIREDATFFDPVWSIIWVKQGEDEDLMVSFGDGRVYRFQITSSQHLKRTQIMITAAAEGKLKGIKYLKKCEGQDISITGNDQARCLALHPADPFIYFVGTSEGVVHRCSTNYYNEHMDLFKAHDGAIHTIKFSPFANKLYYTCGDDFRARLWVDGISEPLVTSEPSVLPVLDVDWSPGHPTIIATIRGQDILIWDIQRKMYQPQSIMKLPTNIFNTVCRFTTNGRCLMVGDMGGNVRVYSLEDMPISPFFPENLISQSLRKLLVTRPDLLKKLRKLGSLKFDKQRSKYFN